MQTCGHCGRKANVIEAWASGVKLCHPNTGLDCYRLVTVYGETVGDRLPGEKLDGAPNPIAAFPADEIIAALRDVHRPFFRLGGYGEEDRWVCNHCIGPQAWPCLTARILGETK